MGDDLISSAAAKYVDLDIELEMDVEVEAFRVKSTPHYLHLAVCMKVEY